MYNAQERELEVAKRLLKTVTTAAAFAEALPVGFSLDALHAQVATLTLTQAQGEHYLVGLKANQKHL